MDEESIPGLPSGDGNEPDLQPAVVERLVRGDRPIDAHVQSDRLPAEEPAERPLRAAHARQLLGEVRSRDHDRAGLADRGQAADVVPMRVGEDHVPDGCIGDLAQRLHRCPCALHGRASIDGDHARGIDEECDVAEVETLGDVYAVSLAHEPGIGESEPLVGSHGDVACHGGRLEGVDPRASLHLSRSSLVAQRPERLRQTAIDRSIEVGREAVAALERRLQIADSLPRLAEPVR